MSSKTEQLRASFDKMTLEQKKEYIDSFSTQSDSKVNPLLDEFIEKYSAEALNGSMALNSISPLPHGTSQGADIDDISISTDEYKVKITIGIIFYIILYILMMGVYMYSTIMGSIEPNYSASLGEVIFPLIVMALFYVLLSIVLFLPLLNYCVVIRQYNHLHDTYSYGSNDTFKNKLIKLEIMDGHFFAAFIYRNRGLESGLSMVKIQNNGKELSIKLSDSQVSSYTSMTMNSTFFTNGGLTVGHTDPAYRSTEIAIVHLTVEEYAFIRELPSATNAYLLFVGSDGTAKRYRINRASKKAIGLIITQAGLLEKRGERIKFKQ